MSHPYGMLSIMLIEAARRAQAAAKEMLALVNAGEASCSEMLEMLAVSKSNDGDHVGGPSLGRGIGGGP